MEKLSQKSKIKLLSEVFHDPERKPVFRMIYEICFLLFYHKRFPGQYFSQYLFKKSITNIKDYYYENFFFYKVKPFLNEHEVRDVIENKLYFNFFYSQFKISIPKILMYNHRKVFVIGNESIEVESVIDFEKLLKEIFEKNAGYDSIFVKRTYGSYGGKQVFKITREQLFSENNLAEKLFPDIIKSGFLFQETVKQHSELNKLSSSSLNTIRFDTFLDKNGKVEILSAFLRMSTNNSHVDNISSGGCQVGIWLQTGKLKKTGYSNFISNGARVYTQHPLTGIVFEGFSLPFFAEAKELVVKAAGYMPGLRLVGWDVAISETGPVLIEGNSDYAMSGNDIAEGGYRTNATFRKILDELNYKY